MKFFTGLSLVASALAVRMDVTKRDSPLKVEIQSVGNSAVKAVITNTGSEPIKLMKTGSILDQTAVEKAEIFSGGTYSFLSSTRPWFNPCHVMHGVLTPAGTMVYDSAQHHATAVSIRIRSSLVLPVTTATFSIFSTVFSSHSQANS